MEETKKIKGKPLEELGCDYLLIPFNRDGVVQIGF